MSPTPAADPTARSDPPTPAVSVSSSHCVVVISGSVCSTAYVMGMLSMTADSAPSATFAMLGPKLPYMNVDSAER